MIFKKEFFLLLISFFVFNLAIKNVDATVNHPTCNAECSSGCLNHGKLQSPVAGSTIPATGRTDVKFLDCNQVTSTPSGHYQIKFTHKDNSSVSVTFSDICKATPKYLSNNYNVVCSLQLTNKNQLKLGGIYTVQLYGGDGGNNTCGSSFELTINKSISLSIKNNAVLKNGIFLYPRLISYKADDFSAVKLVREGADIATCELVSNKWKCPFNTTLLSNGDYKVGLVSTFKEGSVVISTPLIPVVVKNTGSDCNFNSPNCLETNIVGDCCGGGKLLSKNNGQYVILAPRGCQVKKPAKGDNSLVWGNLIDNTTSTDKVIKCDGNKNDFLKVKWPQAKSYCESLNINGRNIWRLPNKSELTAIFANKFISKQKGGYVYGLTNGWYWSGEEKNSTDVYVGNFPSGFVLLGEGIKDIYTNLVRCVRTQ